MANLVFILLALLLCWVAAVPPLQSPRKMLLSYLKSPPGGSNAQANSIIEHYMTDAQLNKVPLATTQARLRGVVQYYDPTAVTKW